MSMTIITDKTVVTAVMGLRVVTDVTSEMVVTNVIVETAVTVETAVMAPYDGILKTLRFFHFTNYLNVLSLIAFFQWI